MATTPDRVFAPCFLRLDCRGICRGQNAPHLSRSTGLSSQPFDWRRHARRQPNLYEWKHLCVPERSATRGGVRRTESPKIRDHSRRGRLLGAITATKPFSRGLAAWPRTENPAAL